MLVFSSSDFQAGNTTGYPPLVGDGEYSGSGVPYAEPLIYQTLFENAQFTSMVASVDALSGTGNNTVTLRKNAAPSAITVSIPSGATGVYSDTIDSVNGVSGDAFNYAVVNGATGNVEFSLITCLMSSAHTTSWMNGDIVGPAVNHPLAFNSGAVFGLAGGAGDWSTTESIAQYTMRLSVHSFGMYSYVTNNTINGTTTFQMRKNGANGSQAVSVGAGLRGAFTDAIDSDDFASGDKTSYGFTPSGSSGSMDTASCTVTCYGTDNVSQFTGLNGYAHGSLVSGLNQWFAIAGDSAPNTNPQQGQSLTLVQVGTVTMMDLAVHDAPSTGTPTLSVQSQVNGVQANMAISAGSGVTGYFEDTVDTDVVLSGANYRLSANVQFGAGNLLFYISPMVMMQYSNASPPNSYMAGPSRMGSSVFVRG